MVEWRRCWRVTRVLVLLIGFLTLPVYVPGAEISRLAPSATATVNVSGAIFFSAHGLGYPVMERYFLQGEHQQLTGMYRWLERSTLRASAAQQLSAYTLLLSAGGAVAVSYDPRLIGGDKPPRAVRLDSSGARVPIALSATASPVSVTDSGVVVVRGNGEHFFLQPDGKTLPFPVDEHHNSYRATDYLSADPRFQVILEGAGDKLALYDLHTQRVIALIDHADDNRGILYHQGDRFLLVPRQGQAVVVLGDGGQRLLGDNDTVWRWGEDGSVWALEGGTIKMISWCKGDPRVVEIGGQERTDDWISDLCDVGRAAGARANPFHWGNCPAWACAWRDGVLLARADMVDAETRRLSLIRNGACIGTFDLPVHTPSQKSLADARDHMNRSSVGPMMHWRTDKYSETPSLYREHLTFSADGKYLTWLLDNGKDTINCYLFAVGDRR